LALACSAPAAASAAHSVYLTNFSPASVATFAVGAVGALTQQGPGVPTGSNAAGPEGLAMTPDGRYLYVGNVFAGTIQEFAVDVDGQVTARGEPVPSSGDTAVSDSPGSLVVSPNGQNLYAANLGGNVATFSIGADGALTFESKTTSGICCTSGPQAVAITANGQFVYVANSDAGTVSTFTVGAGGALTQQGTGVITGTGASSKPWSLVVSPNGQYLFVANRGQGTVSTFTIGAGGALTQVGTGVVSGRNNGPGTFALAITPNGENLYAANSGQSSVSTFTIGAGGALTQQGTGTMTMGRRGSYPNGVAVSPDGRYLYVTNGRFNTVATFAIGAGGALRREQVVSSGAFAPYGVVVSPTQGPSPMVSKTTTFSAQKLTLTTPPPSLCQGAGGVLSASVRSKRVGHEVGLAITKAAFYIDTGVGAKHKPNATTSGVPATEQLSLQGAKSGSHTLSVKLTFVSPAVTKTLRAKFTVCAIQ
jgi:6-phosphogluconolactonase (cycloisomerase 2 family)